MQRVLTILIFLIGIISNLKSQNETDLYSRAKYLFDTGQFAVADSMLTSNVATMTNEYREAAYRLLVLSALHQDQYDKAEHYAEKLLDLNPFYTTQVGESPRFADLIYRLKQSSGNTVFTASRMAETLEETPVPVTLITEEMIKASGATNLHDVLLTYVPGMSDVTSTEKNLSMHGIYSSSQEKILVMLDGHRLNSNITNSESLNNRTSLEKIKQVEVLRGPASSLYGNVALTAVVNIITKSGRDEDGITASAGYGMNNTIMADFLIGKNYMDFDFMAWASYYSSDGEKRQVSPGDEAFYGTVSQPSQILIGAFNRKPCLDIGFRTRWKGLTAMLTMQQSNSANQYSLFYHTLFDRNKFPTINGNLPGHYSRAIHSSLSYAHTTGPWTIKAEALFDSEDLQRYDVIHDTCAASMIPMLVFTDRGAYYNETYYAIHYGGHITSTYRYDTPIGQGNILTGIQLENFQFLDYTFSMGTDFMDSFLSYPKDSIFNMGSELSISAFAQMKQQLGKKLIFNSGLRYDHKVRYNKEKINAFSPRVSLIYRPTRGINLKIGYSRSFVDAPYLYRASKQPTYSGADNLQPETMDAIQLTYNHTLSKCHLSWEVNTYYNNLNDLVYCDKMKASEMYSNAGKIKIWGLEGVLTYRHKGTYANITLSYQKPLSSSGYTADRGYIYSIPPFMMSAVASQRLWVSKKYGELSLHTSARLLSKQYSPLVDPYTMRTDADGNIYSYVNYERYDPVRFTLNIGANYTIKWLTLSLDTYNITNDHSFQGGGFSVPNLTPGFSCIGRVKCKF